MTRYFSNIWFENSCRACELAAARPTPIASEALSRIGQLYAVEKDIRGRGAEEHTALSGVSTRETNLGG
jgi:hypothetical protein